MNSNRKGKVGEREFAGFLRDQGFDSSRGRQFSGSQDSPDVRSSIPFHIEVKRTEVLRLRDAVAQAEGDSGARPWIVAHRWNGGQWLVTLKAEEFCNLVRVGGETKCARNDPERSNVNQ